MKYSNKLNALIISLKGKRVVDVRFQIIRIISFISNPFLLLILHTWLWSVEKQTIMYGYR